MNKFNVALERKIGGYSLLSTSRGIEWSKRTATKHANDVNRWIDSGCGQWARDIMRDYVKNEGGIYRIISRKIPNPDYTFTGAQ